MKQRTGERGSYSNSNINSSIVNTGIAFRWTMDIHIFVQFLPQSGCDKMSANASSEYNLAAARSAFSLSQTPFEQKMCLLLLTELEVVARTGCMCFSSCGTVYISCAIQVILIEKGCEIFYLCSLPRDFFQHFAGTISLVFL